MKKISKQLVALLLAAVMVLPLGLFSTNPFVTQAEAATTNKTKADAIAWLKSKEGKKLDYDGAYGGQCVDLIYYYYSYLGASVVGGNASDYTSNKLPSGWARAKGGAPQKGDILIYAGAGGYGHVAVYENDTTTWHQNWNEHQYVEKVSNVNYKVIKASDGSGYWGYIRPDFKDGGVTDSPKVSVDTSSDKYSITNTNAVLCGNIYNPFGAKVSKCGIKLYDENGTLIKDFSNSISYTVTNVEIWFNINSEVGYTLTRGTKYKYILYGVVDGKTYSTSTQTFTTKGGYTLTYNANGGTGAPSSQSGLIKYTLSSNVPTRSGYTFLGWSTNSGATTASYVGGNTISLSANTTLYAVWQKNAAKTYTLTYDANGGTGAPQSQTFGENVSVYISDICPSRFGYTFSGWKTADGWWYYPGQSVGFFENTTLYAQWDSWRVYIDQPVVFMIDSTTRDGYIKFIPDESGYYVFESKKVYENLDTVGYLYDSNKNEIAMDDDEGENSNFRFSANLTKGNTYYIYVKEYSGNGEGEFRITVAPAYTVTFDTNGGYDAPDALCGDYVYTIPYDEPIREGYEFLGWSAYANSTFADICAGDEIEITGDVTLYAVWKTSYYTIKYYVNGDLYYTQASDPYDDAVIIYDVPENFPYTFTGWKEVGYDGGNTYYPGEELTMYDNLELYAVWEHYSITKNEQQNYEFTEEVPTYWVEFVAEVSGEYVIKSLSDGSGADTYCKMYDGDRNYIGSNDDDVDENFAICAYLTAGERYYFLIGINGEYPGSADLVISRAYNLSYDTNGGDGDFRTQSGDSTYTIPNSSPVRDGYIFLGWSENKNATYPDCYPGEEITVECETTLYAVWEEEWVDDPDEPNPNPNPNPIMPGLLTIRTPSITTIKYGDTIKLHADMDEMPIGGLKVSWEVDNENFEIVSISEDGSECVITPKKSGKTTFTATVKVGSLLFSTDTQVMTSKAGFFDKIIAFFKGIFGMLKNYEQAIDVIF